MSAPISLRAMARNFLKGYWLNLRNTDGIEHLPNGHNSHNWNHFTYGLTQTLVPVSHKFFTVVTERIGSVMNTTSGNNSFA